MFYYAHNTQLIFNYNQINTFMFYNQMNILIYYTMRENTIDV